MAAYCSWPAYPVRCGVAWWGSAHEKNEHTGLSKPDLRGIECADYVIVVDAQSSDATTSQVFAQLRLYTNKPVRYLINTHWHDDHIVGTHLHKDAFPGMKVIGSVASIDYLPALGKKSRVQFHRAIPDVLTRFRKTLETGVAFVGDIVGSSVLRAVHWKRPARTSISATFAVSSPTAARSTARCSTSTSPGRLSPTPGTIHSAPARHQSEHAPRNFQ